MTAQLALDIAISCIPALIAIFTCLGFFIKTLKKFIALKKEVADMKDLKEIKLELRALSQENIELKQKLNETLTKIDRVKRG